MKMGLSLVTLVMTRMALLLLQMMVLLLLHMVVLLLLHVVLLTAVLRGLLMHGGELVGTVAMSAAVRLHKSVDGLVGLGDVVGRGFGRIGRFFPAVAAGVGLRAASGIHAAAGRGGGAGNGRSGRGLMRKAGRK